MAEKANSRVTISSTLKTICPLSSSLILLVSGLPPRLIKPYITTVQTFSLVTLIKQLLVKICKSHNSVSRKLNTRLTQSLQVFLNLKQFWCHCLNSFYHCVSKIYSTSPWKSMQLHIFPLSSIFHINRLFISLST